MSTFVSFFMESGVMFFPLANEQARQNDPVKKNMYYQGPYVLVTELVMLMGRRAALRGAPFFNTSALAPCGHRSEATMGLMKKKKIKIWSSSGREQLCLSCILIIGF